MDNFNAIKDTWVEEIKLSVLLLRLNNIDNTMFNLKTK